MKLREIAVRSWLIKYVKSKHNLPDYDKAVRLAESVKYINEKADVTETGHSLFELSQFNGDRLQKTKNYCGYRCYTKSAIACKL